MSKKHLHNGRLIPAVGYLRRSTDKQEGSIEDQQAEIKRYAEKHSYKVLRWYDDDLSGDDTENRKGFLRMRDDAERGQFEVILCWDQDRFGRFDSLDAGYWIYPLRRAGVRLVTLNDGEICWDDFQGRMLYGIKQEGKHEYLKDLSRNVLRGQMEAAKSGSWIGSVPYAYRLEGPRKAKTLVIGDPREVEIVTRIFREYVREGRSMTEIANRLNTEGIRTKKGAIWRFDAIKTILENVAYIGTFRSNASSRAKYHHYHNGEIVKGPRRGRNAEADWIVFPDHHAPIIDKETFRRAQAILAKGKTGRAPYKADENPYLLTCVLRCGRCGSTLHAMNNGKFRYYECSNRKYFGNDGCEGTNVREDHVLQFISDYLQDEYFPKGSVDDEFWDKATRHELTEEDLPEAFRKLRKQICGDVKRPNVKQLKSRIDKLKAEVDRAKRNLVLLDADNIPAAQEAIRELVKELDELQDQVKVQPSEAEISMTTISLLQAICCMAEADMDDKEAIKRVVRGIDNIVVNTTIKGRGTRRRHTLVDGEIHFLVGCVKGKSNPHRTD